MLRLKSKSGRNWLNSEEAKAQQLLRACKSPECRLAVRALYANDTEGYLRSIIRKEAGEVEQWRVKRAYWNREAYKKRGRDWRKK